MRKISLAVVTSMLLFTVNVLGNGSNQTDPNDKLKKLVKERLEDYHTKPNSDLLARILFVINKEHEIVVLSIDTDDPDFETWIKGRLNYLEINPETIMDIGAKRFVISIRLLDKLH